MENLLNLILGPLRQPAALPGAGDGVETVSGDVAAWLEAVAPEADGIDARDDLAGSEAETSAEDDDQDHWITVGSAIEREVWAWTGISGGVAASLDGSDIAGEAEILTAESGRLLGLASNPAPTAVAVEHGGSVRREAEGEMAVTPPGAAAPKAVDDGALFVQREGLGAGFGTDDKPKLPEASVLGGGTTQGETTDPAIDQIASRTRRAGGAEAAAVFTGPAAAGVSADDRTPSESGPVAAVQGSRDDAERLEGDRVVRRANADSVDNSRPADPRVHHAPLVLARRDTLDGGQHDFLDPAAKPGFAGDDVAIGAVAARIDGATVSASDSAALTAHGRSPEVTAQNVARQIGEATLRHRQGEIEIALSPEELGRVRLVVSGGERGAIVTVFFDRADVLDLMRRHPEQLLQDLRDSGFADARLDLRDGSGGQRQRPEQPGSRTDRTPSDPVESLAAAARAANPIRPAAQVVASDRHLDIRL
ncbi:flagellar hook-length control protein FliK (plasmid) [Paracoccus sp. TK19116]|uniref:Flagellar hook-length control protein FliK n=1 Tax=Paracoccus albicereus TaxID=2922394 RepID=A0ABT1MLP6_9RHOB|nr:flagellar hook-length control protein FliK [Paracoccus albicereus]MCQ0969224.1 flagellar hook-length control protein FliK [Paracoccus albicereus]